MILFHHTPGPPLADFVDLFWLSAGPAPPHARESILPTGTMELVIPLGDTPHRVADGEANGRLRDYEGPLVCGAHSEPFVIDTAAQASIIGVHFKPGGAFPFLPLPAGELTNARVPLEALWGAEAGRLRDRLAEARTPPERFRILERCLLARAARPLKRHPAVAFALGEFQTGLFDQTVADVTDGTGLSPRRFIQRFTEEVGLTPKRFCRVRRFQEVLRLLGGGRPVCWARLALACGYYDQAHFLRDFRAFAGLSPTAYLRDRGEHPNHVPLRD